MPKNKIGDLRNLLFETMEKLMDDQDPMDLDRAKAVAEVGQVIINSAKVEVDFMKQTGRIESSFIQPDQAPPKQLHAVPVTPLSGTEIRETREEDLCQKCTLPDCDDTSARCLVKIKRQAA
jgi:hypothetical protein